MSVTPFTMIFQNRVFAQVRDLLRLPHGRYAPHTAGLSQTELSGLIGDVTVKVLAELQGLKRMAKIAGSMDLDGKLEEVLELEFQSYFYPLLQDALSALRPSSRGPVADEKAGSPAVASEGSPSGMGEAEISPQSVVISTTSTPRKMKVSSTTRPSSLRRLVLLREARHSRRTTITVTVRTPDAQA
ncbi:hypothetical protein A0H81_13363 [Grifola frondosa]|uniref:Uncharacterized protein n=1 Tax=Grifola frondosa TaxID=5627 RepID=A0A1C7LQI0_GRIFR|nr:hypothetical protein A0H81_13363 [Grifola frondosa]